MVLHLRWVTGSGQHLSLFPFKDNVATAISQLSGKKGKSTLQEFITFV
jgi:hypothetical protein